jgi:hypothetical protein
MTALILALTAAWLWAVLVMLPKCHMRFAVMVPLLLVLPLLSKALHGLAKLVEDASRLISAAVVFVIKWVEHKLGPVGGE